MAEQQKQDGGGVRSFLAGLAALAAVIGGIVRSCGPGAEEAAPALRQIAHEPPELPPLSEPAPNAGSSPRASAPALPMLPSAAVTPSQSQGSRPPGSLWRKIATPAGPQAPMPSRIITKTYRLPVLSVLPDGSGECSYVAFSFTRDSSYQLVYANVMLDQLRRASDDAQSVAATFAPIPMRTDPQGVERLFASAYQAAQNSFDKDVVRVSAAVLQVL